MTASLCFLLFLFSSDVELLQTRKYLYESFKRRDVGGLIEGFRRCGREDSLDALRVLLKYYSKAEQLPNEDLSRTDRYRLFAVCSRAIAGIKDRETLVAYPKLALRSKAWASRYILVAGSRGNPKVNAVKLCLKVLDSERHPIVLLEAIQILGKSRSKEAILPLISFWEKIKDQVETSRPTDRRRSQTTRATSYRSTEWQKVPFVLQTALTRLCGKMLMDPELYRSYYSAHKDSIDPTKPLELKHSGRTQIFGLDLVGKNIALVIDVSGSMKTTDPLPPGERLKKGTYVKPSGGGPVIDEDRMRINRAKKELKRVIRSLPSNKSFNIVAFSSDVKPWKNQLVPATRDRKKKAASFVGGLRAKGITVTDYALEFVFQDPIVDTIYLITDGAPTHRGSYGPGLPEDAPELIKQILKRVKVLNFRRGVRIFTLGFPGAEEEFLKRLAKEHGGTYKPIK